MTELTDEQQGWLRMAETGNLLAAFNIGKLFSQRGDKDQAEKFLKIAAEGGHLGGIFKLGEFYFENNNLDLAKEWLKKAADKGHQMATELLNKLE
jgi:uncharacterized protein